MKPKPTRDEPAAPAKDDQRIRPDRTGGAPAAEEDIGTEGGGTEPRESADVGRGTGPAQGDPRDKPGPR